VESPAPSVLIAAELPIVFVEVGLAAPSFTLVGPLGVPWWVPLICLSIVLLVLTGLTKSPATVTTGFGRASR
jgi:hypothetical protein